MTSIVLLSASFVWLTVAIALCLKIPRWLGVVTFRTLCSVMLFPVLLALPLADELLGSWQFGRLCATDAVVKVGPDADKVKRARREPETRRELEGYLIPIRTWDGEIVDVDTGKVFMTTRSLFTSGGWVRRQLNGPQGQETSCHPRNYNRVQKELHLYDLLKLGEAD